MGRLIQPARLQGTNIPYIRQCLYKTGETFKMGAAVLTDANGELTECGANPASILGFAAQAVATGLGYGMANDSQITVYTDRVQQVAVFVADKNTVFSGSFRSAESTVVAPTQTLIGETYGITKGGTTGEWYVDQTKSAANQRVQIVDIDTQLNIVFFKVLTANLQEP